MQKLQISHLEPERLLMILIYILLTWNYKAERRRNFNTIPNTRIITIPMITHQAKQINIHKFIHIVRLIRRMSEKISLLLFRDADFLNNLYRPCF